jgi:hypothetical protein
MSESAVTISHVSDTSALPPAERRILLARFDAITNLIWRKPADIFQRLEAWVCTPDTGLLLASDATEIVGFSVYRRLRLGPDLVIYRETTNVAPRAQGRGVWTAFTRRLLSEAAPTAPGHPVHLAFRTRNPIVYMANYRWCEAIVPDLFRPAPDPVLMDLAVRAAQRLYPHLPLERPAMVISGAYAGLAYREGPRHRDARVTALFSAIPGLAPSDAAVFALGRVKS